MSWRITKVFSNVERRIKRLQMEILSWCFLFLKNMLFKYFMCKIINPAHLQAKQTLRLLGICSLITASLSILIRALFDRCQIIFDISIKNVLFNQSLCESEHSSTSSSSSSGHKKIQLFFYSAFSWRWQLFDLQLRRKLNQLFLQLKNHTK